MESKINMKALFSMTYGMYVVSTVLDGKLNGQIANAAMQITGEPPCVAVCLNKQNLTTEMLVKSGVFGVSVLELDVPMTFLGQYGFKCGRDIDKYSNVNYYLGETGVPIVTDWTISTFEAKVVHTLDLPTHVLFIGEVTASKFIKEATPLTYADYHTVKKGKSPKTAPTFGFNAMK
ncbi:MAG: flavin reductase family protein [Synergistaceae bacterium]